MGKYNNKEYIDLRKELLHTSYLTHLYRMTMFSVVGMILAYLLSQKEPSSYAFLVPIGITYLFYLININLIYSTCHIAAYLNMYHEDFSFSWEKRLQLLRNYRYLNNKYNPPFFIRLPFLILLYTDQYRMYVYYYM